MRLDPEDFVKRLIAHLEAKSEGVPGLESRLPVRGGEMTARMMPFQPGQKRLGKMSEEPAAVVDLSEARRSRAQSRTVSGVFVYTARL